jgi:outer membrane protein OmpA-like peptidoglycan-associated protein
VRFKPGSAQLNLAAQERLKEIALVLLDHPELGAVEIQGHAAGKGASSNALSVSRAETVMVWLVDNGVAPSRLSARGYGDSKSADITEPHAKERVELHLVEPGPPSAQ